MYYQTPDLETERLILHRGNIEDYKADECEEVYDWIMYLKESNIPIGNITADREIKEIHSTELAYNLHPSYWGKGYMKEALIEVMNYLYQNGFDNIVCGYSEGNYKSKRLNEKMGFELYKIEPDAWIKNGTAITDYKTILSKERFYSLYSDYLHKKLKK